MIAPRRPPELERRFFRGSWAVARGLLTRDDVRGPAWQRLFPDVFAPAGIEVDHALLARAAASVLVPGSVVSGRSAAVLWGMDDLAGPTDPVELTAGVTVGRSRVAGVRVRRRTLPPGSCTRHRGVLITRRLCTAVDLAAVLPHVEAVVLLDRAVDTGWFSLHELRDAAGRAVGRGSAQVRRAVAAADGLAGSPQETRLRLVLLGSSLPPPTAQFTVRHDGRFVARTDFAWPERKLALEYEGKWHTTQVAADRRRIEALQAAGWRVLFVTAADLHHPVELVARIAAALAA
ncbi:endonuclease domain-containing protein [Klenkia sp. PcliD-1-E]|uniref:endonuclease domain-containing protein n=1 Tax=Klenkia sp. PcliD-1-E TaxID=2954492 RepID=UPI002097665A|nr:DUF559 domain-containing protein [Klenkia sp. PcliD-1-E]MCO7220151.1 endonuclease domain-containing protein [Klenkia sp. PcliD-1-E]